MPAVPSEPDPEGLGPDAGVLRVGCPRCAVPVAGTGRGAWSCPEHGVVDAPLWRPASPGYESFVEHLRRAGDHPTYVPWPLGPGWTVTDFAVVAERPGRARATLAAISGLTRLDGEVDVAVVSEEPGTGLGARVARHPDVDPGAAVGEGPTAARVVVEGVGVSLWPVSTGADSAPGVDGAAAGAAGGLDDDPAEQWERSALVGEAHGRWLWIVLRPASAVLLLNDDWFVRDVSALGPALVELGFGGAGPLW